MSVSSWRVVLALAVSVVACRKPRWGDKVASELHLAGFTIVIPEGWRSMAELSEGQPDKRLAPDTVGMMPEADRAGVLTASVLVTSRPFAEVRTWKTCAEAADHARASFSPPISELHDGSDACSWRVHMNRLIGTVGIRKVGTSEVVVQCLIDVAGDPDAERACSQVLTTLQIR